MAVWCKLYINFQITSSDADFFRKKYKRLYDIIVEATNKDKALAKRSRALENEILREKITLEKVKMDETEELTKVKKLENLRDSAEKVSSIHLCVLSDLSIPQDLEFTEQKDTMSKFELSELKKLHEELTISMKQVQKENRAIVEPVFESLREQVRIDPHHFH